MRKLTTFSFVLVVAVFGYSSLAGGARKPEYKSPTTVKFSAALNIGQEVPHPKGTKAGASGRFTATLTGTTLKWTLTFSHLSGPATAAHIHMGARGVSGPVIIPLCGPCNSPVSGTATPTAAQIAAMKAGKTYANVHTAKNPGGEIRGQVTHAT
jgi:hypothetical protein